MNTKSCVAWFAAVCLSLVSASALAATPADLSSISGLTLWLDASDLTGDGSPTADGTSVEVWMDKASGVGFYPIFNDCKPTFIADGIDGMPSVRFVRPSTHTAQALRGDSGTVGALFNGRNTAFVVARANNGCGDNNTQDPEYIFARRGQHSGLGFSGYPDATGFRSYRWFNDGGAIDISVGGYTQGQAVMLTRIIDGNTWESPASATLAVNNKVVDSQSGDKPFRGHDNRLYIGCANEYNEWCGGLNGDIAELLVYDHVLDANEQLAVFSYLQRRYHIDCDFEVAAPAGGTDYVGTTEVKVSKFPAAGNFDQYQIVMGSDPAPDAGAWLSMPASVDDIPAISFQPPVDGAKLNFRVWMHDSSGEFADVAFDDAIVYTVAPPTIVVRDISLMVGANGRRALDPADVDYGTHDAVGIASRTVSPSIITEGENLVTFTAVNFAGNSASQVVTVTGTPFVSHGDVSSTESNPLPNGYLNRLLHLGADFNNDYISTSVGGVGGIDSDQLSAFGGEVNIRPQDGDTFNDVPGATTTDGKLTWTVMDCPAADGNWKPLPDRENYIKYWHVYIYVPGKANRQVLFRHNNDDGLRVWVNGSLQVSHGGAGGEFSSGGTLYPGINSVTIKLQEGGGGDYMALRITDPSGNYFDDLTYQFSPYLFDVADPRTDSADFTSATTLKVLGVPEAAHGSDYQVTLSSDPSSLSEEDWTYFDLDNPPTTLDLPLTTSGTEYTVAFWMRSYTDGIVTTNCETTTITYLLDAPTALAKDAAIAIDATSGTTVDPALLDNGSFDDVSGIHSILVDPPVVFGPGEVELVVINNAGVEARATANITASNWSDGHVSTVGDDETGTGRSDAPWRTITHALSQVAPGGTIYLAEGVYDADGGETFPLPALGYSIVSEPTATSAPIIDGGNTAGHLFELGTGKLGLKGLWLCNSSESLIKVIGTSDGQEAVIEAEGCRFTQSLADATFNMWVDQGNGKRYHIGNVGLLDTWTPAKATFDRCVITEIDRYAIFAAVDYASTLELNDCLVESNKVTRGVFCTYRDNAPACFYLTLNRDRFIGNRCRFLDNPWESGYVHDCAESAISYHVGGSFVADRCEFVGNYGGDLIGLDYTNPNPTKIYNSIFVDNYAHQGMFLGHAADLHLYNCTLVRNSGGYCGGPANELTTSFHNCIIYKDGAVSFQRNYGPFPTRIYFFDTILWDTPDGNGWNEVGSSNVIRDSDPMLENPDVARDDPAFDLAPRPYSPAIDAGGEAFNTGAYALDFAGNARLADNDGDGVAAIDLGAYESLFGASPAPAFTVPAPGAFYVVRGADIVVPVSIEPRTDGPVTATVSYSEDGSVTGPSSISIDNGRGPVNVTFSFPRGTDCDWTRITLSDAASPAAVAPQNIDFFISDAIVNVGHISRTIYLHPGQTRQIHVSLDLAGAVAPAAIPVSLSSFTGEGDNSAAWVGDAFIPADASATTGYLQLTGFSGLNTATLKVGGGYIFAETESDSIEISVVGYPGWMAVDPENGSDANIVGSMEAPFRTVSHAIPLMQPGDTLRMLPGTYSPANEAFPWQPGDIALVGYAADGNATRGDYIVDGAGTAATAVLYDGIHATIEHASVANMVFTNFTAAAIQADAATLSVTNSAFASDYENLNAAGGILLRDSALVEVQDSDFTGMRRAAAVFIKSDSVNGQTSITLKRCRFEDNYSNYGTVANSDGNASGYFYLSDCLFRNNAVPNEDRYFAGDAYRANAIMAYWAKTLQIDRCQFLGGQGGTVIASNYLNPGTFNVNDSLFAGNFGVGGIFCGFSTNPDIRNCTFVGNCGGYNVRNVNVTMRNSIICGDGILNTINDYVISQGYYLNPGEGLVFKDTIIWDTPVGERGYTTNQCVNLQFIDPQLKNVSVAWDDPAFDAHLGASSKARDAGDNAYAARDIDLEGNPRIIYGLPGSARHGDPVVDLGCYECEIVNLGTIIMLQ